MNPSPTPEIVPVIWPVEAEWYHCRGHVTRADFAAALMDYGELRLKPTAEICYLYAVATDGWTVFSPTTGKHTQPVTVVYSEGVE
jgi:hypothetical protein